MFVFIVFAIMAFVVTWLVNILVSVLSGEKRQGNADVWAEVFSRMFLVSELAAIGRVLNQMGIAGWPRQAAVIGGVLCLLLVLGKSCGHDSHSVAPYTVVTNYPSQSP